MRLGFQASLGVGRVTATIEPAETDVLQANLDEALSDRDFIGDWQRPWPSIRVEDLGEKPTRLTVPGTKTNLKLEYTWSTIRIESMNPYLGIDLTRLVTERGPGYPARMYCEC
ncbi:MAG: hypothetical protein ACTHXA_09645 [Gulosibacter sp.]|uniref:hypothetical protein n=1 Tax=Gulosibacter sp. TaxID=2817531 RepID=UPI003F903D35